MADGQNKAIDLTGDNDSSHSDLDDDDEDLRRAVALSLQSAGEHNLPQEERHDDDEPKTADCSGKHDPPSEESAVPAVPCGIAGMDRKLEEAERLARLKRKRTDSGVVTPPLPRSTSTHGPGDGVDRARVDDGLQHLTVQGSKESGLQYPDGVVKKTWAFGFDRTGDDIKLEEVLQRRHLEAAVLSSFQWNWDWLLQKLDTQRTKFVFVLQAKDESIRQHYRSDFAGVPNVRLCFPTMEGQINCMHSKLMLLFYPTHLRIVVPTANLVPSDWGEPYGNLIGGVMENTVFLADLPKKMAENNDGRNKQEVIVPFLQSLLYFLRAMNLQDDLIQKVGNFDFVRLRDHGFIHTIGGSHHGDAWKKTGACGLGHYLRDMGLCTRDPISLGIVTSSLGSLNDQFLRSLYLIAQGDTGLAEYSLRVTKPLPSSVLNELEGRRRADENISHFWKDFFRFYYPSEETVKSSKGGPAYGGTICFNSRWWNGPKFPRSLILDCRSQRHGMLMHNKVNTVQACGSRGSWLTVANLDLVRYLPECYQTDRAGYSLGERLGLRWECESVGECVVSLLGHREERARLPG
jgi:hypothetical protein